MSTVDEHALNVRLPTDLYEQLRRHAFEERRTQADIVRDALRQFFSRAGSQHAETNG